MSAAIIFSIIYFIGFSLSLFCGIYTISINRKSITNRIFFTVTLLLCIWLFCFSIANSAPNENTALFWRRLSSLGWGFIYAFLLHYFIEMSLPTLNIKVRKYYFLLIYIPAVIFTYIYGISPSAKEYYYLINSPQGWVNLSQNRIVDWLFDVYYLGYIAISLVLMLICTKKTKYIEKKKEATLLFTTFLFAAMAGFFTDFIINSYSSVKIPQLGPLISLIPMSAVFYSIKRFGLMKAEKSNSKKTGIILDEDDIHEFYNVLSGCVFMAGIALFTIQYFIKHVSILKAGSTSIAMFAMSTIFWLLYRWFKNPKVRDMMLIIFITVFIPVIELFMISETYYSLWALPAAFMLLSVIYNHKALMLALSVSIIGTQIYIWITRPVVWIKIGGTDNLSRLFFFVIFILAAYFVKGIFVRRLNEIENKARFQSLISEISAGFVNVSVDNYENKINEMLRDSIKYFDSDRSFVILYSQNKSTDIIYEYSIEDKEAVFSKIENSQEPLSEGIVGNDIVEILNTDDIPDVEVQKIKQLKRYEIKSLISIPLKGRDNLIGSIIFSSKKEKNVVYKEQLNVLEVLANLLSDAYARIESEKKISHMAYYDDLTELPNKRFFDEYIANEINGNSINQGALLLINYNDLQCLNLAFGYQYAENLIKISAKKLTEVTSGNMLFCVSDDRFVVYIKRYKKTEELRVMCTKIIEILKPGLYDKYVSVGIGIVELDKYQADAGALLKYADIAASSTEQKGNSGYAFFNASMEAVINRQNDVEAILRRIINEGINNKELYLNYQPIIDLKNNQICSFEALARINCRNLGEILPVEFIRAAEEAHLIYPIGEIIIRNALTFLKALKGIGYPNIVVSINISAIQLMRDEFISDFLKIIDEYEVDPTKIQIEIVESVFMENYDNINRKLIALKNRGILVAIDDFGTGYSSFSRERDLNVNCLKIDKYFINNLMSIDHKKAITGDIISMAHKLGHIVVAEGIEYEEQKQYLIKHGCDMMQGYLFSRPLQMEKAIELLCEHN